HLRAGIDRRYMTAVLRQPDGFGSSAASDVQHRSAGWKGLLQHRERPRPHAPPDPVFGFLPVVVPRELIEGRRVRRIHRAGCDEPALSLAIALKRNGDSAPIR